MKLMGLFVKELVEDHNMCDFGASHELMEWDIIGALARRSD